MTTTAQARPAAGRGAVWLRRVPWLALMVAIAAVLLLALGPLGWRAGWWHYRFAFQELMPWAFWTGIAAMALAAAALLLGRRSGRHGIAAALLALLIGGAIAYVPWHYNQLRGSGPNDITTDLDDPPAYRAVLALRQAEQAQNSGVYKGAAYRERQRRAYPDILPLTLPLPPQQAFARALAVARQMGWAIVSADAAAGQIEASDRSRWFGFTDDIAIRVTAAEAGSRIDVRSSSRLGNGDFGVNAARVRAYLKALRAAAG